MPYSAGQVEFKTAFEINPITLSGGIAGNITGGLLPLSNVINALNFSSVLSGSSMGLDDAFAYFYPLPGATLIENDIGKYPFANMAIAANAIIKQPLNVSLLMRCPVNRPGGYSTKQSVMTSLQKMLDRHCSNGGTFIVATPSFFFTDVILVNLQDVSGDDSKQAQIAWKWDFHKPLVALQDAQTAQNAMMQRISDGVPTEGELSGSTAINSGSAASSAILPSATTALAAGVPAWPASWSSANAVFPS